MLGFGKKKKGEQDNQKDILNDVSYLNKKELIAHTKLKEKLGEHLLPGEPVLGETACARTSFFLTDRRIIIINPMVGKIKEKKDIKRISVDSIYYNNISSVSYRDGVGGFGSLLFYLQGNLQKASSILYEKPCKELYKFINSRLNYNVNTYEPKSKIDTLEVNDIVEEEAITEPQEEKASIKQIFKEQQTKKNEEARAKGEEIANKLIEKTKGLFKK